MDAGATGAALGRPERETDRERLKDVDPGDSGKVSTLCQLRSVPRSLPLRRSPSNNGPFSPSSFHYSLSFLFHGGNNSRGINHCLIAKQRCLDKGRILIVFATIMKQSNR